MNSFCTRDDPSRQILRLKEWPIQDQRAWSHAISEFDILGDDPGRASLWSSATRKKNATGYGRFLGHLLRAGMLKEEGKPADRISPEHVHRYVAHLKGCVAPVSVVGRIVELRSFAVAVEPSRDWTWLDKLIRVLKTTATPIRDKDKRLRDAEEIWTWAYRAMDALMDEPPSPRNRVRFRNALIVAVELACPMRIRNLSMVQIDAHLVLQGDRHCFRFTHKETKNHKPLLLPVPASLARYLRWYRHKIRTKLLNGDASDRLWITMAGKPMTENALYCAFISTTKRAFGRSINPHLFRDIAATFIAMHEPGKLAIAAPLLGHSALSTTEKFYIHAKSIHASRRLQRSLEAARQSLPNPYARSQEIECI